MGKQLVAMIDDRALCERAVRNARNLTTYPRPRWVIVRDTFGCGRGFARHLCLRYGLPPDEEIAPRASEEEA